MISHANDDSIRKLWTVVRGELIGLEASIVGSTHEGFVGMKGTVVDETLNTLVIQTPEGDRTIPKTGSTFSFRVGGEDHVILGRTIRYRPEDRPKKIMIKKVRADAYARKRSEEEGEDTQA